MPWDLDILISKSAELANTDCDGYKHDFEISRDSGSSWSRMNSLSNEDGDIIFNFNTGNKELQKKASSALDEVGTY